MKNYLRTFQPALIIGFGIMLALAAASMPSFINSQPSAVALRQITTATPTVHPPVSQVGSTSGITLMGFIIVLIIVLPILLRRQIWTK